MGGGREKEEEEAEGKKGRGEEGKEKRGERSPEKEMDLQACTHKGRRRRGRGTALPCPEDTVYFLGVFSKLQFL